MLLWQNSRSERNNAIWDKGRSGLVLPLPSMRFIESHVDQSKKLKEFYTMEKQVILLCFSV